MGLRRESPRWIRNRRQSRGLILLYHRIGTDVDDPYNLCVTPDNFAEHLSILKRFCRVVSLETLVENLKAGRSIDSQVVITFDDGYRDNLINAKPLLERADFPATVFVVSGFLENARGFWWDELYEITSILAAGNGRERQRFLEISEVEIDVHTGSSNRELLHRLHRRLRTLPDEKRQSMLDQFMRHLRAKTKARGLLLSESELSELASSSIEIGAHTVTHPVLRSLPLARQREEIMRGKEQLEAILGKAVKSFAYPFGLKSDYTRSTVQAVRDANFERACAASIGPVWNKTSVFELPRLAVKNVSGDTFYRMMLLLGVIR